MQNFRFDLIYIQSNNSFFPQFCDFGGAVQVLTTASSSCKKEIIALIFLNQIFGDLAAVVATLEPAYKKYPCIFERPI